MKTNLLFIMLYLCMITLSCKKESSAVNPTEPILPGKGDSTIASANFDFKTTRLVSIHVNLATSNNEPIAGVPVNILSANPLATEPLFTAITDSKGELQTDINLPAYVDTVVIDAKYIGLMRNAQAAIINNAINATIGGTN